MPAFPPSLRKILIAASCMLCAVACTREPPGAVAAPVAAASGCLESGEGSLEAQLRGALVADLQWINGEMQCDGGPQPDGSGIRITVAGPLPGTTSRVRFIFGIDLHDAAAGVAQAFPTNLTVLVEGGSQLYSTRGTDKCAVETLQRTSLSNGKDGLERVKVRGYCVGPASDIPGSTRVLVPTFSFTGLLRTGDEP
jgi:hypothetical protein